MLRVKAFFPYIVVGLVVLVVAPIAYKSLKQSVAVPSKPIILSGGEIGQRIAQFVERTQRPDGSFYVAYECLTRGTPCTPLENPRIWNAGQAIVALSLAGRKDSADKAMRFSLPRCKNDSTCDFIALDLYYQETGDDRYRAALEIAGKDALAIVSSAHTLEDYVRLSQKNIPEKLARMYELTKDVRYRDALKKIGESALREIDFANSQEAMAAGQYGLYSNSAILSSKALIYVFKATGDTKYRDAYKSFFDTSKIASGVYALMEPPYFLYEAVSASAEGLAYLSTTEANPADATRYRDDARLIVQTIVAWGFDGTERPLWDGGNNLLARSGATPNRSDTMDVKYKATNENGRIVRLLLTYFKDTSFSLSL